MAAIKAGKSGTARRFQLMLMTKCRMLWRARSLDDLESAAHIQMIGN